MYADRQYSIFEMVGKEPYSISHGCTPKYIPFQCPICCDCAINDGQMQKCQSLRPAHISCQPCFSEGNVLQGKADIGQGGSSESRKS